MTRFYKSATLMLLDKENMTRQYIDDYFQENHISLQDIIEVSNMDLVIEMAKVSLGVGCVIKDFVKEELQNGTLLNPAWHPDPQTGNRFCL